ncbi:MAG: hypothetical protein RBR23_01690 [Arcobacteraceae bacterium]|jgi:phage baseplate assembly protein W|nr:hypothetical protein [Arcobacteraceae bacterium]
MAIQVTLNSDFFSATEEESFMRIITTPKGSRVVRPYFGSNLHELVDNTMDEEWKMKLSKYVLECFFDENHNPWDKRLVPKSVKIIQVDATLNIVNVAVDFEDTEIEFNIGGF